ncbi:MAG: hypothetical protein GF313_04140 [Caldithrix sp.]|nr:hypothetical protein [Caldithrix sp.]
MREVSILNEQDIQILQKAMESSCQLLLPIQDDKLGAITFHVYSYENKDKQNQPDVCFQIRWGTHKIFNKRHLKANTENSINIENLKSIVSKHCQSIKKQLIDHCQNQLNNWVMIELDPHIQSHNPDLNQYELKVSRARSPKKENDCHGWPCYCVVINWNDELGEFQEFLYHLHINPETRRFELPKADIVKAFQHYRDTVI